MISITPTLTLQDSEIEYQFVRASGPGGQNVNKVATATQLRFDVIHSPSLSPELRERVVRLAGRRMSANGVLVLDARRFRTQERNRQDALERLIALLRKASELPKPRRATRPTLASKKRRLAAKRQRGEIKRERRNTALVDE